MKTGNVFAADQWAFDLTVMLLLRTYSTCWFICFRKDFWVGWLISKCPWSPAKRIVSFHVPKIVNSFCHMSERKWYLHWKCSLFPSKTMISDSLLIHLPNGVINFCHTSAARSSSSNWSFACNETMSFLSEQWGWRVFVIRLQGNLCKFSYVFMLWCEFGCGNGILYNLHRFLKHLKA